MEKTIQGFALAQMTVVLIRQKSRFVTTHQSFRVSMLHVKSRHISRVKFAHCR